MKDRTRGEVDQAYLDWVHDQPIPKVMPEGSIKGPIDREAELSKLASKSKEAINLLWIS